MQSSRAFVDSFGFHWQVIELGAGEGKTNRAPQGDRGFLYFLSRSVTRVLREYPNDWDELDWSTLEDLCARALPLGGDSLVQPATIGRGADGPGVSRARARM